MRKSIYVFALLLSAAIADVIILSVISSDSKLPGYLTVDKDNNLTVETIEFSEFDHEEDTIVINTKSEYNGLNIVSNVLEFGKQQVPEKFVFETDGTLGSDLEFWKCGIVGRDYIFAFKKGTKTPTRNGCVRAIIKRHVVAEYGVLEVYNERDRPSCGQIETMSTQPGAEYAALLNEGTALVLEENTLKRVNDENMTLVLGIHGDHIMFRSEELLDEIIFAEFDCDGFLITDGGLFLSRDVSSRNDMLSRNMMLVKDRPTSKVSISVHIRWINISRNTIPSKKKGFFSRVAGSLFNYMLGRPN